MRSRSLISLGLLLFTAIAAPRSALAGKPQAGPDAPAPPPAAAPAPATPAAAPAAAPEAAAPAPPAGANDPNARAAQLYQEGNEFYDQGKYAEAEVKYQAAWDLAQSFDVAGNLGNTEMLTGQYRDAAEHLTYALKTFPLGGTPQKRKFLEDLLDKAKAQIGTLQIAVNLNGAEVRLDGKRIGESPILGELFVAPGEREIEVRRGTLQVKRSILVAKGSSQRVAVQLESGPRKEILITGGAVGAAGIGLGVVFAILSSGKGSDAAAEPMGSPVRAGLRDDQTVFGNVSFWSFVGGGLALAGTGVYWLIAASEPAPTTTPVRGLRATPIVTGQGGGLMLGGSF
ncbi:PEGA domain-containing protein [Chondromyces crocatus]|uniref:PEGA domain-containing protein n=1 Tax=Chondromyces crocatus TaxID=52 RepID=A0A0K1E9B3_CHOCO|nr:PEGA domain-containing protein [Chondromyces crocatus]AKT37158.1 uncharacterized protein CMC5_012880 [Chondromyces crocatus]